MREGVAPFSWRETMCLQAMHCVQQQTVGGEEGALVTEPVVTPSWAGAGADGEVQAQPMEEKE